MTHPKISPIQTVSPSNLFKRIPDFELKEQA